MTQRPQLWCRSAVQKGGAKAPSSNTTSANQPAFMGGMVHGWYRKALAMLSDNASRHLDAQQRQPAGFHIAPLVKVTIGIKY